MLTLIKNYSNDSKSLKRINVKKMISLKELNNKQIKNIIFKFSNLDDFQKLKKLSFEDAETEVKILFDKGDKIHLFQLKDKRKVNNQLLNSMNLIENILIE